MADARDLYPWQSRVVLRGRQFRSRGGSCPATRLTASRTISDLRGYDADLTPAGFGVQRAGRRNEVRSDFQGGDDEKSGRRLGLVQQRPHLGLQGG
jgi:hypothetical protein